MKQALKSAASVSTARSSTDGVFCCLASSCLFRLLSPHPPPPLYPFYSTVSCFFRLVYPLPPPPSPLPFLEPLLAVKNVLYCIWNASEINVLAPPSFLPNLPSCTVYSTEEEVEQNTGEENLGCFYNKMYLT